MFYEGIQEPLCTQQQLTCYFKMLSSVNFATLPEMSGREPETDFSPKRMPALKGGAGRS